MERDSKVGAVVLAAGMSQRMGRLKALLPFGEKPMLARVLENLKGAGNIAPIFVVLGYAAEEIAHVAAQYDVELVYNAEYEAGGMLSSIQKGVGALPSDCQAFFLVLGDQPGVRPDTLRTLLTVRQKTHSPVTLPTYEGKRGHPILLAAWLIPEILALPADATLKTLITQYTSQIQAIPVLDSAVLADVDTPEDYERALREFAREEIAPPPRTNGGGGDPGKREE